MTDIQGGNDQRRYAAIIVAAGRGERAGVSSEGPKQYRTVGGKPVLARALEVFVAHPLVSRIVVVIHPEDNDLFERAVTDDPSRPAIACVHGGATRQASVLAGLRATAETDATHVLIHDAARPFLTAGLIDRIEAAFARGAEAVLPAGPLTDTIKRADACGLVAATVSREGLFAAQTPQAFALPGILAAHEAAATSGRSDFTDDASIAEAAGIAVRLVEGEAANVKLTTRKDIEMAAERLEGALPDVRTGNGYDVHQLGPGKGVTLCGVFIDHDQALVGHSDADVGLHALTDALLATCGAGDIGDHFPPSDEKWRGAASHVFVERAVEIVTQAGGTIMNADVSLIAEAPRIGPHRLAMREALAAMLRIEIDRCSVKATTNETIGFIGRREGIAAIATATVVYSRRAK